MDRLYDRAFKIGFLVTLAAFVFANVIAYMSALRRYDELRNQLIGFSLGPLFPKWGFPFNWEGYNLGWGQDPVLSLIAAADGVVLNFLAIAACGFIIGIVFRSIGVRWK